MNQFANFAFVALALIGVLGAAQAADGLANYAFRTVIPNKLDAAPSMQTAQTRARPQKTSATGYAVYAQRAVTPVL